MLRLQRIFKNYDETGSINEPVNLYGFVDSQVFLTKPGDLGVIVDLIAVGLLVLDWKTIRTFENFRPLVIRIDDLGRAEAINYHNLEYKPQDAEAKYFLSQFCALYYRRNRYTIQNDFSKALYFLDGKLAGGILDAYRKDGVIKKFLMNTSASEIDVEVKKVALEKMQTPPFKARVDFHLVYYSPGDHSEIKRDLYTANFVFVFTSANLSGLHFSGFAKY
jgi:type IV secretion system protein VirB5